MFRPILLVLAIGICWLGVRLYPLAVDQVHQHDARAAYHAQLAVLGPALDSLGFADVKSSGPSCHTYTYPDYATPQRTCLITGKQWVATGTTSAQHKKFVIKAKLLDSLLKLNGWTDTKNAAPSFGHWMSILTEGASYQPDEEMYYNTAKAHCSLSFFSAFSAPNPPAFSAHFACESPVLQKYKTYAVS